MAGKVIHISDDLHEEVKKFCDQRDMKMTPWVTDALQISMQVMKENEAEERKKGLDKR